MNNKMIIGLIFLLLCTNMVAAASSQTIEYPTTKGEIDAQFIVTTLKYEPFPVTPGDWFDLWVKVENVGEEDATNVKAELRSDSNFEVEDPIQEYGTIDGTVNAYIHQQQLGDKTTETNQVLLRYHVRVKPTSLEGANTIQLSISADGGVTANIYDLPIDIAKTKTDFNVNLNMISPQGATFVISNKGDRIAKALVVEVKGDTVDFLQQYSPASIGDLPSGDVATALLRALPKEEAERITLDISYTDIANVRTTIQKTVLINKEAIEASKNDFDATLNEISPHETVITVSNIGSFLAKSVNVGVKGEGAVLLLENYAPASLSDLESGEVAVVHLKLLPKDDAKDLTLLIQYTDDTGTRRTSEKKIPITKDTIDALCPPNKDLSYLLWVYGAVGFLCGAFLIILAVLLVRRNKEKKK